MNEWESDWLVAIWITLGFVAAVSFFAGVLVTLLVQWIF